MMTTRQRFAVALAVTGVLATGGSAAAGCAISAGLAVRPDPVPAGLLAFSGGPTGAEACSRQNLDGQGTTAGTSPQVCIGSGLSFIGPSIGQVATVIGPTTIGPAQVNSVVSAGNGAGV
jgi:hypothetical protein